MATYYVAKTGSDSNPGTLASPFLTINKGVSVMVGGDTLLIRAGVYNEALAHVIPSGISSSQRTVIRGYQSESVEMKPLTAVPRVIDERDKTNIEISHMRVTGDAPVLYQAIHVDKALIGNPPTDGWLFDSLIITCNGGATDQGKPGILMEDGNVIIRNCEIYNIVCTNYTAGGNPIYVSGDGILIENNYCHDYDRGAGIRVGSSDGVTTSSNAIVRKNRVDMKGTTYLGFLGIISFGPGTNWTIYDNVVSGGVGVSGYGIRAYSGLTNIYNNTVYNVDPYGIFINSGVTANVRNNIVYLCSTSIEATGATITQDHNLFTDPSFLNESAHDFHITAGSAARNTGATIAVVPDDFDGVSRPQSIAYDIGAYELVGGANWYVDNSLPNGNGSSASPFNSIQNAFNNSALQAGDHIKIRTGTGIYDQNAILTKSGISGNPITIQPDTGASFIVRFTTASSNLQTGAIVLQDCSYVTVSGLNFNGAGINTPNYALEFLASSTDPTNLICTGCTFQNWGGSQAFVNTNATRAAMFSRNASTSTHFVSQSTITNCTFTNNRQRNISILGGTTHTISNNTITGTLGGRNGDGSVEAGGIKFDGDSSVTGPNSNPTGHIVSNNSIHDFAAYTTWTLSPMGDSNWFGVYGDVNIDNVDVRNNTIYNIGTISTSTSVGVLNPGVTGNSLQTFGINPESRCDNWLIHENILYRLGTRGILLGSFSRHGVNHSVYNNTIYKMGAIGIMINTTDTVSTLNSNIVLDAGTSQIDWEPPVSVQGFVDYNCYFSTTNVNAIGRYDTGSVTNFTNYKAQSGFDSHSISVNPLFVSLTVGAEDFHLQSSSPCIATGFNNVTMGALPFIGVANVATNSVGDTTFSDTWITAAAADTQTAFGTTTSYNGLTAKNISSVTSHADSVFNLTPNTLYHFRALSSGASSPDQVIITNLPPATSLSMS